MNLFGMPEGHDGSYHSETNANEKNSASGQIIIPL
jgi:hypothetical protein